MRWPCRSKRVVSTASPVADWAHGGHVHGGCNEHVRVWGRALAEPRFHNGDAQEAKTATVRTQGTRSPFSPLDSPCTLPSPPILALPCWSCRTRTLHIGSFAELPTGLSCLSSRRSMSLGARMCQRMGQSLCASLSFRAILSSTVWAHGKARRGEVGMCRALDRAYLLYESGVCPTTSFAWHAVIVCITSGTQHIELVCTRSRSNAMRRVYLGTNIGPTAVMKPTR